MSRTRRAPTALGPNTRLSFGDTREGGARIIRTEPTLARYAGSAVSDQAVSALLSTLSQARAHGQLTWSREKAATNTGTIVVQTAVADCAEGMLRIYFVDPRPDRIHVQYLINKVPVRRLDVNDSHRGMPPNTTHKHRYIPATGGEDAYIPTDIPPVPSGPTVAVGTYRQVFEAFASECFVSLPAGYWTEPGR